MPAAPNTATNRAAQPPARPPASAPAPKSRLGLVKKGKVESAHRYLFYGPAGVGKSSLVADVEGVIFLDVEGGADELDVARYPFRDEKGGHVPKTFEEFLGGLDDLINSKHPYRAVAIDTLDALEVLIHKHLLELHKFASIEDFGYGKGYQVALDEFRRVVVKLDQLKAHDIDVFLLAHSAVKNYKNPDGEDFDKYQLAVHEKLAGLAKGRCDVVGFVQFEGGAAKLKADGSASKRARGWMSGRRVVYTAPGAAYDAKTRLALPAEIELGVAHPWAPFIGAPELPPLADQIAAELDRIGAEQFTTASGRVTTQTEILKLVKQGDESVLTRVLASLRDTETPTDTTDNQENQ
jgi:hypothetical protein